MNQLSLITLDDPVREAAKKLIRTYVIRGDSLESLRSGQMGTYCTFRASISGYLHDKKFDSYHIIVTRDTNGNDCETVFKLDEIYNEIKGEV